MILMVTEEAVTVREYRFRLVQKCKNAVNCRLLWDEIPKIFWGGGTAPSPDPTPTGRGTPKVHWFRASGESVGWEWYGRTLTTVRARLTLVSKSCHITAILPSLYWLWINEPTKFSQLLNLHTFITLSPFNVLVVLALHPSLGLLLLGHLYIHHPLLKLLIAPFGISFAMSLKSLCQPHSGTSSYASDSSIPSPITSSSSVSSLVKQVGFKPTVWWWVLKLFQHSPSHCRLKTYLQILSPVVPLPPPGLPSRTFASTVSSELIGFLLLVYP